MEFNDKCVSVRIDPTGTPGRNVDKIPRKVVFIQARIPGPRDKTDSPIGLLIRVLLVVSKLHRIQVKGVDDRDRFLAEKVEPVGSGLQHSNVWGTSTHNYVSRAQVFASCHLCFKT